MGCTTTPRYPSIDEQRHHLRFQFRIPAGEEIDKARIDVVSNNGIHGMLLESCQTMPASDYVLYEGNSRILWDTYRAIVIQPANDASRIFELRIPLEPLPSQWSEWTRPDFTSRERMIAGALCQGSQVYRDKRDMSKPPHIELRYRVED